MVNFSGDLPAYSEYFGKPDKSDCILYSASKIFGLKIYKGKNNR